MTRCGCCELYGPGRRIDGEEIMRRAEAEAVELVAKVAATIESMDWFASWRAEPEPKIAKGES